jgi:phosphoglycerate dehydrogenase-like enzyme
VYGTDELDTVMAQSDYLVVCMALTEQTRHMLRAPHFRKAKKGQVLINIGRGALLDENALVEALQRGDLAAAALDVFTVEPLPKDSPLWDMPNVLVSPHNADLTEMSRYSSVEFFTKNCDNFVSGRELECVVDKEAGY